MYYNRGNAAGGIIGTKVIIFPQTYREKLK